MRHVDDEANKEGKGGGDQDYHLVVADPKDKVKTMIVEFPHALHEGRGVERHSVLALETINCA